MAMELMEGHGISSREAEQNEATELLLQKRRCFFHFPCLGATGRDGFGSKWSTMMRAVEIEKISLWFQGIRALNRLRHWSGTMARPRWKSFLRRFNTSKEKAIAGGCGCGGGCGCENQGKFRYDPHSYALNFDEGPEHNENFSVRYAVVPASVKATVV